MKLNNVKLEKKISFEGYRTLVRSIVDVQINSGEYRPWEYTLYRPAFILAFCISGIELEDGEKLWDEEITQQLYEKNEINELLCNQDFDFIDPPQYFYDAEQDAEKLITQWLEDQKPINSVLRDFDGILDTLLSLVKNIPPETLKSLADLAATMQKPEVEEQKEQLTEPAQGQRATKRRTARRTTKPKE